MQILRANCPFAHYPDRVCRDCRETPFDLTALLIKPNAFAIDWIGGEIQESRDSTSCNRNRISYYARKTEVIETIGPGALGPSLHPDGGAFRASSLRRGEAIGEELRSANGALPVTEDLKREDKRRKVGLIILPTPQAIEALAKEDLGRTNAILRHLLNERTSAAVNNIRGRKSEQNIEITGVVSVAGPEE